MDEERIRQLLGSEFAQDDPHFDNYSVRRDDLLRTLANTERKLVVINAPRGSGKSGLLIKHAKALMVADTTLNIVIRKYMQDLEYPTVVDGMEGAVRFWKRQFLEWMVVEIGARIDVPVDEHQAIAVEFAERAGRRVRPATAVQSNRTQCVDAVLQEIVDHSAHTFWLLLDEMDDLFDSSDYKKHRLAALLYAAKAMHRMHNVLFRITIRPHIMTILRTEYDHVQQLRENELPISWQPKEIKKILAHRILFAEHANGGRQLDWLTPESDDTVIGAIKRHFDDFDMKFSEGRSRNYFALWTVSLGRPRWMLEFCALALKQSDGDRAGPVEYQKAMHQFGNNRIQFLTGEHKFHAPELSAAINSLAGAGAMIFKTSSALRMAIERHVLGQTPTPHRAPKDPIGVEALEIAKLLFMVEFIRAREGSAKNYRFYSYSQRPSLLDSWSHAPKISWTIHPTFGRALNIIDNQTYSVGDEVRVFGGARNTPDDDDDSPEEP